MFKELRVNMKDLIQNINLDLSNHIEKCANEYIDALCTEDIPVPDEWKAVAAEIATDISKYEFPEDAEEQFHPFFEFKNDTISSIGFDKIIVCPYFGSEMHNDSLISNYIFIPYTGADFMIDMYNCEYTTYEDIYENVIQELFNFRRDAQWVVEGTYEENMKEMSELKHEMNKMFADLKNYN